MENPYSRAPAPVILNQDVMAFARLVEIEFEKNIQRGSVSLAALNLSNMRALQMLAEIARQPELAAHLESTAKRMTAKRLQTLALLATPVAGAA